ncbi:MAG: bifunctional riboflavin kinase/FAD synthetase [Halioglobus sp.]
MELIRGLHNLRPAHGGCVATIGAFDGVHRGHRAVIERLLAQGKAMSLPTVVIVFEPLPREYLTPLQAPARLMSFREKFIILKELGVDRVLRIRFNDALRSMSADAFVEEIFVEGLGVKFVALGDDFRFGADRQGDFEFVKRRGEVLGFDCQSMDTLTCAGERVSSTRVREALADGDFTLAEELLGRPYSISGRVVYGRQLGREIGAPTANVELHRLRSPLSGVFAVEVSGAGLENAPGVANVGTRPTVNDSIRANLEVHLLNRDINLYGQRITVRFKHKLREEKKFGSLDELKENIQTDINTTAAWFASH